MSGLGQSLPNSDVRVTSVHPSISDITLYRRQRRNGPCVDGSELARRIFTLQAWSVQPCVRPLSAVHMTAGHNALRGSGPGQKPAFKNALARVGCPDRRTDRLCITCCSPSQPSHHATVVRRDSSDPQRSRSPCQQCGDPRPILGAMELGIADDGECACSEQAAQIAIASFADIAKPVL
jgi:hypothetical protein